MTLPTAARLPLAGLMLAVLGLPAAAEVHRDIDYNDSAVESKARRLDIYTPSGPAEGARPVLVYVHGGGWSRGDRSRVAGKPDWLESEGFVLVSVGYRLLPEGRHPAAAADLAAALAWIAAHIGDYGGDPSAVFLLGHSSGGHVVSLVASDERLLAAHRLEPGFIRGVICLDTGVFDIELLIRLLSRDSRRRYFEVFGTDPARWRDASPAHHLTAGRAIPPFLLLVAGAGGSTHYLGGLFAARLEAAGVDVTLIVFQDETHGSINAGLGRADHAPTQAVEAFTRRLLQSASSPAIAR